MATDYARKMGAAVGAAAPLLRERGFKKQRHVFNSEPATGLTQVLTFQMGAHQPPGTTEAPGLRENLYGRFTINLCLHFAEVEEIPRRSPAVAFALAAAAHVPPAGAAASPICTRGLTTVARDPARLAAVDQQLDRSGRISEHGGEGPANWQVFLRPMSLHTSRKQCANAGASSCDAIALVSKVRRHSDGRS